MVDHAYDENGGDGGNRIEGNDRRALIIGLLFALVGTLLFFVLVATLIGDPDPTTTTTLIP
ncbi:MAG TPA: hypothetical protein VLD62_00690 [Acidimicrobiia bacterium]|nr:hypothetical protein [Acidimicrobiia bacterium]